MRLADFRASVEVALAFCQPRLRVTAEDGMVVASGEFLVAPLAPENSDMGALATYQVRIVLDPSYPEVAPFVTETGGAIPRSDTRHINGDGTCCVLVWEAWKTSATDISISAYMDGPLRNFFLGQRQVALGGAWPLGEWGHGAEGLVSAYAERLGCRPEQNVVLAFLRRLRAAHRRGGVPLHWLCPCGSQRMIGGCCRFRLIALMETINVADAQAMFEGLSQQASVAKRRSR